LEENLLDVKRLLKNSAISQANKQDNQTEGEKKALLKVNVDPFYIPKDENDKTIVFESRFESGNLAAAVKVSDADYHLLL
jgi:hypothetical protein